jgi:DNA polymerase IV (DinB-like DNA polymerase)
LPSISSRVVLLVDLDYFYAQCEETRNPSLKEKPVVVCMYSGRTKDSGAVSTSNYIARKYGVKSGMSIFLAKKILSNSESVFLPADLEFYKKYSDRIMNILKSYSDIFEKVSIDEAYLDVTQIVQSSFNKAFKLALKLKKEVKIKEKITCSIGIGSNKLIAKIAADFHKPNNVTMVKPNETKQFLNPLPVSSLIGIGKKTSKKMESIGIKTVGELANKNKLILIEAFGRNLGTFFHNSSLGIDNTPVKDRGESDSISRIITLKENTRNIDDIMKEVDKLCLDINLKSKTKGFDFKTIGIIAVMENINVSSRSRTLEKATSKLSILQNTVKELFNILLAETDIYIRRVGVKVSKFEKKDEKQKDLSYFLELH